LGYSKFQKRFENLRKLSNLVEKNAIKQTASETSNRSN